MISEAATRFLHRLIMLRLFVVLLALVAAAAAADAAAAAAAGKPSTSTTKPTTTTRKVSTTTARRVTTTTKPSANMCPNGLLRTEVRFQFSFLSYRTLSLVVSIKIAAFRSPRSCSCTTICARRFRKANLSPRARKCPRQRRRLQTWFVFWKFFIRFPYRSVLNS